MLSPTYSDATGQLCRLDSDTGLVVLVGADGQPTGQTRDPDAAEVARLAAWREHLGRLVTGPVIEATRAALHAKAEAALTANRVFLADDTVTNADAVKQLKALTRQVNAMARLMLGLLDDTSDT